MKSCSIFPRIRISNWEAAMTNIKEQVLPILIQAERSMARIGFVSLIRLDGGADAIPQNNFEKMRAIARSGFSKNTRLYYSVMNDPRRSCMKDTGELRLPGQRSIQQREYNL